MQRFKLGLSAVIALSAKAAFAATLVSITVTPTNIFVNMNTTQQFTAMGHYSDGTSQNITSTAAWTSSVVSVGPVSTGGLATANGAGVTVITATVGSINGSGT